MTALGDEEGPVARVMEAEAACKDEPSVVGGDLGPHDVVGKEMTLPSLLKSLWLRQILAGELGLEIP